MMGVMTYSTRHVEGFLADAERVELRDGEEFFAHELAGTLTPERVKAGVQIDFGSDQEMFARAVELLKLDKHLGHDLSLIQAIAASEGSRVFVDAAVVAKVVSDIGFVRALNILQTRQWRLEEGRWMDPTRVPESVHAGILIGQPEEREDGLLFIDREHVGIQLVQMTNYKPAFYDEWGNQDSFTEILTDIEDERGSVFRNAADLLLETDGYFVMPGSQYVLKVSESYDSQYAEINAFLEEFEVKDGHIVPVPKDEDEEAGDEIDWDLVLSRRRRELDGDDDGADEDDSDEGEVDDDDRSW